MAWNEPGGEKRNPWNRPQQSQNDLDDVLRNFQRRLSALVRPRRRRHRRRRGTEFRRLRQVLEQHPGADRRRLDRQRRLSRRSAGARRGVALRQVSANHRTGLQLASALADRTQIHRQRVAPVQRRRRRQHAHGRHQSGGGQVRGSVHPAGRAQVSVQSARRRRYADPGQRKRDARGRRPGVARQGAGLRSLDHRSRQVSAATNARQLRYGHPHPRREADGRERAGCGAGRAARRHQGRQGPSALPTGRGEVSQRRVAAGARRGRQGGAGRRSLPPAGARTGAGRDGALRSGARPSTSTRRR